MTDAHSTFNMNDQATVELTEAGARIYNAHYADMPASCRPRIHVKGELLRTELWQIARIFGTSMYNGVREVPFARNEIILRRQA